MRGAPVRVVDVQYSFDTVRPSSEFAFGASIAGDMTFAHARVLLEDDRGRSQHGWGAILLSTPWAFPSTTLSDQDRDHAMRGLLQRSGEWLIGQSAYGHPLDFFLRLEDSFTTLEHRVASEFDLNASIPRLATLVAVSPLDAAIHDAYGRKLGLSSFETFGPSFTGWEIADILGSDYDGWNLQDVFASEPASRVSVYHTVGATDSIEQTADKVSLHDWIERDGVFAFKVKLKGKDIAWDASRLLDVYRLANRLGVQGVRLFADLNEQAPSVAYIEDLLNALNLEEPGVLKALDAIEQPTSRDMSNKTLDFSNMRTPVTLALDEGLTSLETIEQAHTLGYRSLCLKTCKAQSLMVLAMAVAQRQGLSLTVQDLTNPGVSLFQSLGMAARLPMQMPVETNQRQFYPDASQPEKAAWPELFKVVRGHVSLNHIQGAGFGFDPALIDRPIFKV